MTITHFGHACVLVETDAARLLFDPGTLASGFESAREVDAVFITHQHPDHLDPARLGELMAHNDRATLYVDAGSASIVAGLGLTPTIAEPGQRIVTGGAVVDVLGGEHAEVHPMIPLVPNAAYVLDDGAFFHPGDSFAIPEQDIDVLAVPTSGPWLKLGESIDFVRTVHPRIAVPIHEAALANTHIHYHYLASLVPDGTTFVEVPRGVATTL